SMCQRLEQIVCEKRMQLGYDMSNEGCWTWDEDEELDELDVTTIERYRDLAQSQLRRGTNATKFTKPAVQAKKRQNRLTGVKQATSRLNHFNNSEFANTTNEGIGSAIGNALKRVATQSIAHGLGVSASGLHKFGSDLLHSKTPKAPT